MKSLFPKFQRIYLKRTAVIFLLSFSTLMAESIVDFSKGQNLETLYEGGLRPWRVHPDEMSSVTITNEKVHLITPWGASFLLDVEIGSFEILAGNKLASAEFISQPTNFSEAAAKARAVCSALGISSDGLEEKTAEISRLGDQTSAPQYWSGNGEKDGVRYGVTFYPLFGFEKVGGKVFVTFKFYQPGMPMKFLEEPVKPPPGYEHISMDPPKPNSDHPFPDPAFNSDEIRKRIDNLRSSD